MSWLGYKANLIRTWRPRYRHSRIQHRPQEGISKEETRLSQSFLVARSQRKKSGRFLDSFRPLLPFLTRPPLQSRRGRGSTSTACPGSPRPPGPWAPGPPCLSCTFWDQEKMEKYQIQVQHFSQIWKPFWVKQVGVLPRILRGFLRRIIVLQHLKNVMTEYQAPHHQSQSRFFTNPSQRAESALKCAL
mgnify:CR=1 FL=1